MELTNQVEPSYLFSFFIELYDNFFLCPYLIKLIYSRKDSSPNHIEFFVKQKTKKLGGWFCYKYPTKGKFTSSCNVNHFSKHFKEQPQV